MNNQIKDLKLQTFGGKESEVAFACENLVALRGWLEERGAL